MKKKTLRNGQSRILRFLIIFGLILLGMILNEALGAVQIFHISLTKFLDIIGGVVLVAGMVYFVVRVVTTHKKLGAIITALLEGIFSLW